jgi:hypothetical protein
MGPFDNIDKVEGYIVPTDPMELTICESCE